MKRLGICGPGTQVIERGAGRMERDCNVILHPGTCKRVGLAGLCYRGLVGIMAIVTAEFLNFCEIK